MSWQAASLYVCPVDLDLIVERYKLPYDYYRVTLWSAPTRPWPIRNRFGYPWPFKNQNRPYGKWTVGSQRNMGALCLWKNIFYVAFHK